MSADGSVPAKAPVSARSDLADSAGWVALGIAVLVGSVTMDRLERQGVNPYTVPGLLPALLGIAMILLGTTLALRSLRRGALHEPAATPSAPRGRIAVVLAMCIGYAVLLVGHGLPFWLASAVFVTSAILVLQRLSTDPQQRRLSWRAAVQALVIGLGAAGAIHLVFQDLFLVHLP